MKTTLVALFTHNKWANLRLLAACAGLEEAQLKASAPGTYGNIADTLLHLLAAEARYVTLLTGRVLDDPIHERKGFPGLGVLREHAAQSGDALIGVAQDDPYEAILKGSFGERTYKMRAVVPLVQAIHHAGEHRDQVMTILGQLGVEQPDLSGWAYATEMGYDYDAS
jgi:uncharacterized damage-inducible protein DinB